MQRQTSRPRELANQHMRPSPPRLNSCARASFICIHCLQQTRVLLHHMQHV